MFLGVALICGLGAEGMMLGCTPYPSNRVFEDIEACIASGNELQVVIEDARVSQGYKGYIADIQCVKLTPN